MENDDFRLPALPNAAVPVLGFAAFSGTGKTALLKQVIPLLTARGLRVGLIKHSHHAFEIDHPGKDSHTLRLAGANPVMLSSARRRAIIMEHSEPKDPVLNEELAHFEQAGLDLILVEGFRHERFPKIELHRPILGKPLLYPNDDTILAIAADAPLVPEPPIRRLDLNEPGQIVGFILTEFLR